jgi:hypothetical protein
VDGIIRPGKQGRGIGAVPDDIRERQFTSHEGDSLEGGWWGGGDTDRKIRRIHPGQNVVVYALCPSGRLRRIQDQASKVSRGHLERGGEGKIERDEVGFGNLPERGIVPGQFEGTRRVPICQEEKLVGTEGEGGVGEEEEKKSKIKSRTPRPASLPG